MSKQCLPLSPAEFHKAGQKTLLDIESAFNRLNVRRLFIALEKPLARLARQFLFEFNDDFTRRLFKNACDPFMRDVKARILALETQKTELLQKFTPEYRGVRDIEAQDGPDNLHSVGVAAKILKVLHTDDDSTHVMVNCLERFIIEEVIPSRRMLAARVRYHFAPELSVNPELKAFSMAIIATLKELVQINPLYSEEIKLFLNRSSMDDPGRLADLVASNLGLKVLEAQAILEMTDPMARLRRVNELLAKEIEVLTVQQEINTQAKGEIDRSQREFYLREQMKVIQTELGEGEVYDISVEDTHRYAAAGFVNHNSFWHSRMMTNDVCDWSEIVDYAENNAGVMATSGGRLNPYKLGIELFRDIEDRWNRGRFGPEYDDCRDMHERESWNRELGQGREKIFEVRRVHNDVTFIDEFFTLEFCRQNRFFTFVENRRSGKTEVESREFKKIKDTLLQQLTNFGQPFIYVVDANHSNRGELYLRPRYEGTELKLDPARDTLPNVQAIWSRPVHLETVLGGKGRLLSFDGSRVLPLAAGDHEVTIEKDGKGTLYYAAYLKYFNQAEKFEPSKGAVKIERKYAKVTMEGKDRRLEDIDDGATVKSGDLIEVSLTLSADIRTQATVLATPDALHRILTNLLENAVRHTPKGGVVEVRARRTPEGVTIEVLDEGPGIPEAERARVFERFYRSDRARSADDGGSGLGLAIARWIVVGA